ncbi:hypothetical protein D3C86_1405100 [compost metagenome]
MASRASSERSAVGWPGNHRQDPQVRPGKEPRLAGREATGRRSVGGHLAPLPARHPPVRQGDQPDRLRRVRRDRSRYRRPGPRVRNGLDQQERGSVEGCPAGRRSGSHGSGYRRRQASYQPGHEAVQGQSVGRFQPQPQEGRQADGPDQVDHRLRRVHRPARWHRWPGAPVRPVLARNRRRGRAQVQEGRRSGSRGTGHRRRQGTHLAGYQATVGRPVQQLHLGQRQGFAGQRRDQGR